MTAIVSLTSIFTSALTSIQNTLKLLLCMTLACFSLQTFAADYQLEPNQWESLVIPANPNGRTIRQLLADDMGELEFNQDWVVFTFDSISQNYNSPVSLDMVLQEGQAFWIVQTGDTPVTLDLPANLPISDPVLTPSCGSEDGCHVLPLPGAVTSPGDTNVSRYHFIGSPFPTDSVLSDLRLTTTSNNAACNSGCTLAQASTESYSNDFVWAYNSETETYDRPGMGSILNEWQGYWLETLPEVQNKNLQLEFAYNSTQPPTENLCKIGITTAENVLIPSIDKPNYRASYTDPAFGAKVTRITNSAFGEVQKPMYSTIQAWNADESLIVLYHTGVGGGYHFLLDGQTYEPVGELDIYPSDLEEVFWSHTDPDTLYYVSRATADFGEFKSYNVSAGESTKIRDFTTVCGSGRPQGGGDVHMQSLDDDLFGFTCLDDSGQHQGLSYQISTDELNSTDIGDGTRWDDFSAPMPGPSGERFWFQGVSLSTDLSSIQRTMDVGDPFTHSNVGLAYNGQDALFQTVFNPSPGGCAGDSESGIGHLVEHNLETGACRSIINQTQGYPYTTSSTHVSAQAYKRPGWVALSSIGRSDQFTFFTNNQSAPALLSEIYLANTDPNDSVTCRLAHHRSFGKSATRGGYAPYFGEPHVTISPSGTRILFGSDWYDSGSVDTYVIELPAFTTR